MPKTRIRHPEVAEPPPETWSNCLKAGNLVFVAGMTARGGDFDSVAGDSAYEQARTIFAKIEKLMRAAGGSLDDVVKLVIYVADIAERDQVWRARREVFRGDFPVSTLVQAAALAHPAMKVEIEAVGVLGAAG